MLNTRGSLSSDGNNKKRFESLADEIRVCLVSRERQRERERRLSTIEGKVRGCQRGHDR